MHITQKSLPNIALWTILASMLIALAAYRHWTPQENGRGVIKWDVISYYSYLPATFIYEDLGLSFMDDPDYVNDDKFWPLTLDDGTRVIQTSMGLSILYSPFFFAAQLVVPLTGHAPDGYSAIYQFFLLLSALFWVMMGLLVLKRILLRWFTPLATALTLILLALGTNLFFYTVHDGAFSHGYSFALITFFLYLVIRWYESPTYGRAMLIGLLFGLIVLIRPSNILVGFIFLAWGIKDLDTLKERPLFLFRHYSHILLMALLFLLPWIPQLIYWKSLTGNFLFNSYGPGGSSFFFNAPHVFDVLFSFRKGWFLYTPVMLVAAGGIFLMGRKCRDGVAALSILLVLMIYLSASWWSWWFGGTFGHRAFVDIYGMMALPLAAFVDYFLQRRKSLLVPAMLFLSFLLYMNQFQTTQYMKGFIHHTGMTREAYSLNFLKIRSDGACWQMLSIPDASLARLGIYVEYYTGSDYAELKALEKEDGVLRVESEVRSDKKLMKEIDRYARRSGLSGEEAIKTVVDRIYSEKMSW